MAHLVEKMFYVQQSARDFPWHIQDTQDRTTLLAPDQRPKKFKKARKLAGLDWDPVASPMFEVPGSRFTTKGVEIGKNAPVPVDDFKLIRRSDTGAILDASRDSYEIISNSDMGMIIDTILKGHPVRYETGGCLDGGRKVWMMLQLGDLIEVPGDPSPHARYLAILNHHDGNGTCKVIATNVRIVCANTFHAADMDAKGRMAVFSFHHKARWREHVDALQADVKAALTGASQQTDGINKLFAELTKHKVSRTEAYDWLDEFIFPTKEEIRLKPVARRNMEASREEIRDLLEGPTCEGINRNVYGLVMAATEWADHMRGYQSKETYLNRSVFSKEDWKYRAYRMGAEQIGAKPADLRRMVLAA